MRQDRQTRSPRPRADAEVRRPALAPGGTLVEEVSDWGEAARDAMARIQSGETAEQELHRRHNTGGQ